MLTLFQAYIFMILILTTTITITTAQRSKRRDFKIILKDIKCIILSSKISKLECFSTYENKRSAINVNVMLNEDLHRINAHIKCTIFRLNQRNFNLIDTLVDVCQLFSLGTRGSLMRLVMKQLKHTGFNFFKGCPLKQNISYGVKNFYTDSTFFRLYSPDFNYTTTMEFFSDTEKYAIYKANGAVCLNQHYCETYFDKDKRKLE